MSKKAIRYIVALLAVTVCFSSLSFTAFAEGTGGTSSQMNSSSEPVQHETDGGKVLVTFDLNGGTGMNTSAKVSKDTKVSEFKTPTRKGYKFAGWKINGSEAPGSLTIATPTNLTAEWTKRVVSSRADSADTKQREIEAAASAAEQAKSDPGMLSSEDWGALLNSSAGVSSAVSSASSQTSSAAASTGGFSTLFLVGVILVVIGAAGIGTFIYLQFIRGKGGKGGPRGPGGSGMVTDDTIVFTDISSYSDGKKHSGELFGAVRQQVPGEKTGGAAQPLRQAQRPVRSEAAPRPYPSEKAQAKPVSSEKSDFDWEKFFNEDSGGRN